MVEQRGQERVDVRLIVDYDGADDLISDYTENLSNGGTFIHTERAFPKGTMLQLVLSFPGLLQPLAVEGIVRWSREGDQPGVGVELVGPGLARVATFVDELRGGRAKQVAPVIQVLVADDNRHVTDLLCTGIAASARRLFGDRLAFAFTCAEDGAKALHLARTKPFDMVIIEVYLPVLDGAQVIGGIRSTTELSTLPIIAVSGGGDAARASALAAGADLFLDKPMRLRMVLESMRRLVRVTA